MYAATEYVDQIKSVAVPKNHSPQSASKTIHRRARRARREKPEKIIYNKAAYAAPEYVDSNQFHCRPQKSEGQ